MARVAAVAFALLIVLVPAAVAGPVRVTFTRIVPPTRDLGGANRIAVVYAIGDDEKVTSFVEHFVEYTARSGQLNIVNAVENNLHMASFDEKSLRSMRRRYPADAYVGVSLFTCAGEERAGEVGEKDADGKRIRTKVEWLDAVCSAKIDIRRGDGKRLMTFMTHGEGTSPRVSAAGDDERDIAYEQATRYAALKAAESIAPRVFRESFELDESAPGYEEAAEMIRADRLSDARAVFEAQLSAHRESAALHYDLAILAEALGDVRASHDYFGNAARLAPRYRSALELFRRRNGLAKK